MGAPRVREKVDISLIDVLESSKFEFSSIVIL